MLKTLRIRNIAIIEDLTVEFGPGLNLLTGETGAGKSILVDALGLAAGDRADSSMVRGGAERAIVEGVFEPVGAGVRELLEGRGVDTGDDLVVRREVAAGGGGRVFINGSPAAVAVLREIGDRLVELHGQHEHQSLLSPDRHRELLDHFGGNAGSLERVVEAHAAVLAARRRLEEIEQRAREREDRVAALRRRIEEIDAVAPRAGELEGVERELRIVRNSEAVARLLQETVELLYEGETTASSLAASAEQRASELAEIDPGLAEVARRIGAARLELEDTGASLRDYRDATDFDPDRLETLQARKVALDALLLRHGPDEEAALRGRDEARRELERFANLDEARELAGAAVAEAEKRYAGSADGLSRARGRSAGAMKSKVEAQFRALALERARFAVRLAPARAQEEVDVGGRRLPLRPTGVERAEFVLAANPGEPERPLVKVASGGELSRVMLALHAVLRQAGDGRVLVFDEVDAGVAGAVADAIGARLARLAKRHQVLCVTHLPQVAAHADRHYHVTKRVVGQRTRAEITPLSGGQRVDELARMLGGRQPTAASRRNAADLLAAAAEARRA